MNTSSTTPTIPGLDMGLLSSEYVEQVYSLYEEDPARVSAEWQNFFHAMQMRPSAAPPAQATTVRPVRSGVSTAAAPSPSTSLVPSGAVKSNGAAAVPAVRGQGGQAGKPDVQRLPATALRQAP